MFSDNMEFRHPFTMIVAGPTGCGKTVFVNKMINSPTNFNVKFTEIIWCFSEVESIPYKKGVTFVEGLNNLDEKFDGTPKLLIIDDLMHESNDKVVKLFTKTSHHKNISVIFITQNLFHQSKYAREMALNSHYLIAFKNPRDKKQIEYLARQLFPENPKYVIDAYRQATLNPHGYLLFDLKQDTDENKRLKSDVFESHISVFVQK